MGQLESRVGMRVLVELSEQDPAGVGATIIGIGPTTITVRTDEPWRGTDVFEVDPDRLRADEEP